MRRRAGRSTDRMLVRVPLRPAMARRAIAESSRRGGNYSLSAKNNAGEGCGGDGSLPDAWLPSKPSRCLRSRLR